MYVCMGSMRRWVRAGPLARGPSHSVTHQPCIVLARCGAGARVFSRPGPLLVASLEALVEALHPEAQPYGHAGRLWSALEAAPAAGASGSTPNAWPPMLVGT